MKYYISFLIAAILMNSGTYSLHSQSIDVCGNDTIVLKVDNYHYGTVEWQRSSNMEDWTYIPNARNFEYSFLPEENMYY